VKKSFLPKHLELRYKTYYSILVIPKDVRVQIGKSKFFETTGTSNLVLAQSITMKRVIKWKSEIESCRQNFDDPIISSSLELRRLEKNEKRSTIRNQIREIIEEEEQRIKEEQGEEVSQIFKSVSTGKSEILKELIPKWKEYQENRKLSKKNIDQMYGDVVLMTNYLPTTDYLVISKTSPWVKYISRTGNLTPSSVTRIVKSNRNFFKFLQHIELIPETTVNPFIVPNEFKISKNPNSKSINKVRSWVPFENHEVVNLYQESVKKKDTNLSDLILIGCYTGMRIEEICSLKKSAVDLKTNSLKIIDGKTNAGNRLVPIHPKIKTRIKQLLENEEDEYLIPNLTFNKYGDRSNSVGKRFGNLKDELGYSDRHVFHSIRKTVTTQLENSYVNENITADIIGHEKPRITYGKYSGGTNMEVKLDTIKKISYDFSKKVKSPIEILEELEQKKQSRTKTVQTIKTPTRKTVTKTITKKRVVK